MAAYKNNDARTLTRIAVGLRKEGMLTIADKLSEVAARLEQPSVPVEVVEGLVDEVERLRKANSNHLRSSLVKIADDYERLAFPEDDPTVRRTREKILKDVRKIVELAR